MSSDDGQQQDRGLLEGLWAACGDQHAGRLPTLDIDGLAALLGKADGAARITEWLTRAIKDDDFLPYGPNASVWHALGNHFRLNGRPLEALGVIRGLYEKMLAAQASCGQWLSKSTPLVIMADCHQELGQPVHARRYLMMTLIEEAIPRGEVGADGTVYDRLVGMRGLSEEQFARYADEAHRLFSTDEARGRFPEWILQNLDQEWMCEYPSDREAMTYIVSRGYMGDLLTRMVEAEDVSDGEALEETAQYILSMVPGCRAQRRQRTFSTDYDVAGALEGDLPDFRSELGRYFVCECKDWARPADVTTILKFCRVLDAAKCRFGIIFSRCGISGEDSALHAAREQLKYFQDRGTVIVVVGKADLDRCAEGANFITLLRDKYETVRLDLRE